MRVYDNYNLYLPVPLRPVKLWTILYDRTTRDGYFVRHEIFFSSVFCKRGCANEERPSGVSKITAAKNLRARVLLLRDVCTRNSKRSGDIFGRTTLP